MSVVGNCGVQSSCSKSFLCLWLGVILCPKSRDDFSPMGTTSPLRNLLLGISGILPLGKTALMETILGAPGCLEGWHPAPSAMMECGHSHCPGCLGRFTVSYIWEMMLINFCRPRVTQGMHQISIFG